MSTTSRQRESDRRLDERTCRLVCPIAASMVGVCVTTIGIIQVVIRREQIHTLADDLLAVDATMFLVAMLCSYFALRLQRSARPHGLERLADVSFIAAMILLTATCFVITYWMQR